MKKYGLGVLALVFVCANLYAQTEDAKAKEQKTAVVKQHYAQLQEQHIVVRVLAQQYNKELAELRRAEAVFCDVFNLDVDKWRKDMYLWDEDKATFVLKPEPVSAN